MLHLLLYGVLAILLGGVLFAAAARFLPAGEQIAPPVRDEPPWELPPDREMRADDVDSVRLPVALRGYRFAETDQLLDRLAAELRARDAELSRLRGEPGDGDESGAPLAQPLPFEEAASAEAAANDPVTLTKAPVPTEEAAATEDVSEPGSAADEPATPAPAAEDPATPSPAADEPWADELAVEEALDETPAPGGRRRSLGNQFAPVAGQPDHWSLSAPPWAVAPASRPASGPAGAPGVTAPGAQVAEDQPPADEPQEPSKRSRRRRKRS